MRPQTSPTGIRYAVVGITALMAVLLYLDRFCISFAEVYIKEDLGLSDSQVGWMLSAFFWTYALGQVPSGWLTDRFGSRLMLTLYVLLWSAFTALTGMASLFLVLLLLRLGFGFAQAGAYPTGASIISKWVPFESRGTASSIVAVGGRVGGWLAMFATGYLIVWLTPASTPALLESDDILNARKLCHELVEGGEGASGDEAAQRVWETIRPARREAIQRCAQSYGQPSESESEGSKQQQPLSLGEVKLLTAELNRLIDQRGLFVKQNTRGLALDKEADRMLEEQPSQRTEQQSRRLNRLVLEAIYPDSLRKLYVAGWRPMMWTYGALGLLVGGLVWWGTRDRPSKHPACNAAEVELIENDPRMSGLRSGGRVKAAPILPLLRSRSIWLDCLWQWCTNVGWVFIVTWAPRYFQSVHDVPVQQRALMVSIPPLVGWAGMLLGGRLTDGLTKRVGVRWGRALPMSLSRFFAMSAYIGCLFQPSPWLAVAMFSLVAFSTDLGTAAGWAFKQDVGGRYVGSVLGWGNMWGNLGAAVTPPLLIYIVGEGQNWEAAFITCAAAFLLSGLAALGIDATRPVVSDEEEGTS